jgi:hypothetical protein
MRMQVCPAGGSSREALETNDRGRVFPEEWGSPPSKLSLAVAPLPEGYGIGSVTLRSWILHRLHAPTAAAGARRMPFRKDTEAPEQSNSPANDEMAHSDVNAETRRMLRQPDVPWAPDGGSWSDYMAKVERDSRLRRQRREAGRRPVANEAHLSLEIPIVPPLLLESFSDLLRTRNPKNRPVTPLSTRHLLHELQRLPHEEQSNGPQSCFSPSEAGGARCSHDVGQRRPDLLAPAAHAAALTQQLIRERSLKERFREFQALNDEDKKQASLIISQRAKIVRELRRRKSPDKSQKNQLERPPRCCFKTHQAELQPTPSTQLHSRSVRLTREIGAFKQEPVPDTISKQRIVMKPPANLELASRQRLWLKVLAQASIALSCRITIQKERTKKAEMLKRHNAARCIQKLFRWKLLPHYVRQLVNSVTKLKPWLKEAIVRWRLRKMHRSADILRCSLMNYKLSNKITVCIRAFKKKVILLQRNIRSFLACTAARVIRLFKLLHIQVQAFYIILICYAHLCFS